MNAGLVELMVFIFAGVGCAGGGMRGGGGGGVVSCDKNM